MSEKDDDLSMGPLSWFNKEQLRRAAACSSACAEFSTKALEGGVLEEIRQFFQSYAVDMCFVIQRWEIAKSRSEFEIPSPEIGDRPPVCEECFSCRARQFLAKLKA